MDERGFTQSEFRDALGSFATGVTIITARGADGAPVGMTASSFNSVSMDPPLILWSVAKTARSAASFRKAERFTVHVLAVDQTDLSNRFARQGGDKFAGIPYQDDVSGVPILDGVSARYDCKTWAVYEGGDHWIIVGEVMGMMNSSKPALVFGRGAYSLSAPLDALSASLRQGSDAKNEIRELFQFQISQIFHTLVVQFHDVILQNGLSVEKWRVCSSLYGVDGIPFADLAQEAHLATSELRRLIDEMTQEGLCSVSGKDLDHVVSETPAGHDIAQRLIALAKKQQDNILSPLSDDEKAKLKSALAKVIAPRDFSTETTCH